MSEPNQPIRMIQYRNGSRSDIEAQVIVEAPVTLTVNGEIWLAFMCTPVHLEAMAVGFLFNEGVIQSSQEIAAVQVCASQDNVDVWLTHAAERPKRWRRTSGCTGGLTSVEGQLPAPLLSDASLSPENVCGLIDQLFQEQSLYRKTGGVHTSALSDGERIQMTAEDIGRHNTLDKIAGRCLLEGIQPELKILVTTGRVSSEMLQKAARLGATVIISRTSPSSLSIQMAHDYGITLIGYARRDRFNIYTHPERILEPDSARFHRAGQRIVSMSD